MQKDPFYYIGLGLVGIALIWFLFRSAIKEALGDYPYLNYIFAGLFMVMGLWFIKATYHQYDYLVDDFKYRMLKKVFGSEGVRVVYYFLGVALFILGLVFILISF